MLDEKMTRDAQYKERAYKELSNAFASTKDIWTAIHAQFLSDLAAVTALGHESPAISLDGTSPEILNKLAFMDLDFESLSGEEIANLLRDLIETEVAEGYREEWRKRLSLLDHLADKEVSLVAIQSKRTARLEGLPIDAFIQIRFNQADEYATRANNLAKSGRKKEALDAALASDMASFEAWLVARSVESNDVDLVITEIKWALAKSSLSAPQDMTEDFMTSVNRTRSRLVWVVGKDQARDLVKYLSRIDSNLSTVK